MIPSNLPNKKEAPAPNKIPSYLPNEDETDLPAFDPINFLIEDNNIPAFDNAAYDIEDACLYPGYPRLYMQFSHKPTWTYEPNWYNGFEYVKDLERGVPYCEDLWVPGYFEIPIKKGESIIFSAGLSEVAPKSLAKMYESEIAHRTCRTSFFNCLKNAVKQCYLNEKDGMYLISGYPCLLYTSDAADER